MVGVVAATDELDDTGIAKDIAANDGFEMAGEGGIAGWVLSEWVNHEFVGAADLLQHLDGGLVDVVKTGMMIVGFGRVGWH